MYKVKLLRQLKLMKDFQVTTAGILSRGLNFAQTLGLKANLKDFISGVERAIQHLPTLQLPSCQSTLIKRLLSSSDMCSPPHISHTTARSMTRRTVVVGSPLVPVVANLYVVWCGSADRMCYGSFWNTSTISTQTSRLQRLNGTLPILDVLISRRADGVLGHGI